jgi:lipoprotein-releasing system ATP-binding protein
MSEVLSCTGLSRRFQEGALDVWVFKDLSLQVQSGEFLAVVGASGSGKSTLLHILGGLDQATSGQAQLMGRNWLSMNTRDSGAWRNRHLGFVYQFHHLLPELSALDNVAMPLRVRRLDALQARDQAEQVLIRLGMQHRLAHLPAQLSGGERQRVAMARALVTRPACVLADEPTGNLDRFTSAQVFELMMQVAKEQGTAFVVVTHDEQLAARCDRVFRMEALARL